MKGFQARIIRIIYTGLEKAVQTILEVRFGNVKCVDKADITGIINTIRQVRSYALKKARGLKKLVVCLI